MDIFYTPPSSVDTHAKRLQLSSEETRHAVQVLRKRVGDQLICADGVGHRYHARITSIQKHEVVAEIFATETHDPPRTSVTIGLSLLRTPDRFDFFLEKATELGVSEIIPLLLHRTVSRPQDGKQEAKRERWQKHLIAASKQARRMFFPKLHSIMSLQEALVMTHAAPLRVYFDETRDPLLAAPSLSFIGVHSVFFVGGEGGFSAEERDALHYAGVSALSLGIDILRAETAALFAAALVKSQIIFASSQS